MSKHDTKSEQTVDKVKSYYSLHSRTEFEGVFYYPLFDKKNEKINTRRFDLRAYLIYPLVVDIDEDHYSREDFYRDLKALVRLRQPKLSFSELIGNSESTPIAYLENFLELEDIDDIQKFNLHAIDEAKLFGVSFNKHVYRKVKRLAPKLLRLRRSKLQLEIDQMYKEVFEILQKGEFALKHWSEIVAKADKNNKRFTPRFLDMLSAVEEYCYYVYLDTLALVENKFIELGQEDNGALKTFSEKVKKLSAVWYDRTTLKFPYPTESRFSYLDLEFYGFRRRALKKKIQSVLYLNVRNKPFFVISSQFGAMMAAGIAAACATVIEIYIIIKAGFGGFTKDGFGIGSLVFFMAFIFAYILKDRIKEVGRKRFRKGLFMNIPDHSNRITYNTTDAQNIEIGKVDESMDYMSFSSIPKDLQEQINTNRIFMVDESQKVVCYHKTFTMSAAKLVKYDAKLSSAHDIFRYNINRFFQMFDEPVEKMDGYLQRGHPGVWSIPKSYYFDFVFVQKLYDGKQEIHSHFDIVRLVANKKGLIRCKKLSLQKN